jgi:hypothetical protein
MPYRAMALVAASVMMLSGSAALAQKKGDSTTDSIKLNSSRSNIGSATSGGGAGKTINTSRIGGGGGARAGGAVQLNPQPEPPGKTKK